MYVSGAFWISLNEMKCKILAVFTALAVFMFPSIIATGQNVKGSGKNRWSFRVKDEVIYYDSAMLSEPYVLSKDERVIVDDLHLLPFSDHAHVLLYMRALFEMERNNYARALDYLEQCDSQFIYRHLFAPERLAFESTIKNLIGYSYWKLEEYDKAFVFLYKVDSLNQIIGDAEQCIIAKFVLSENHRILGQYADALHDLKTGEKYLKTLSDFYYVHYYIKNISLNNQYFTETLDSSLLVTSERYLNDLFNDKRIVKYKVALAHAHSEKGFLHKVFRRHEAAIQSNRMAEKFFFAEHKFENVLDQQVNILHLYCDLGKYHNAISLGDTILDSMKIKPEYRRKIEVYQELALANKALGNHQGACLLLEKFIAAKVEEDKAKYSKSLAEVSQKYQAKTKDQEIKLITERRNFAEKDSRQKSLQLFISVLISLLVIFGLVFSVIQYYAMKKAKRKIEEQKLIVDRINLLNQKIFTVISHDFKGPMLSLDLLLKMNDRQKMEPSQFETYTENIRGNLKEANLILENLLSWSKIELGHYNFQDISSNVGIIASEIVTHLHSLLVKKSLKVENEIPEGTILPVSPDILKIIFRNLLSNAVKYSHYGSKVRIGYLQETSTFFVQDFGIGIANEQQQNLFTKQVEPKMGTNLETGYGIGLYFVYELLLKYGGAIRVESETGVGTTFFFSFNKY